MPENLWKEIVEEVDKNKDGEVMFDKNKKFDRFLSKSLRIWC